jgi:predicted alpha/beta superfamily hydrolase
MTPRETFRANRALTRGSNDYILGDQMQAALDTASREHDLSLTLAQDVTTAAANRWRKEGADKFRNLLENLNAPGVAATAPATNQLNHKV